MKKLLIVSFDIIRPNEPEMPYNIAALVSYLNSKPEANSVYQVSNLSFNLYNTPQLMPDWNTIPQLGAANTIAIGCYVWGHIQSISLMKWLKVNRPDCKIIAGGYQISDSLEENLGQYPLVHHFIHGTGEFALYQLITGQNLEKQLNNKQLPENSFAAVYSNQTIKLNKPDLHVRMETKRNCPYGCSFCSYQTGKGRKTNYFEMGILRNELMAITKSNPSKINITDPVFNMGSTYIPFLEEFTTRNSATRLNVQVRPELVQKAIENGRNQFLEICSHINIEFELGLQTIQKEEMKIIERENEMKSVLKTLEDLTNAKINYGISLIYGLPGQTIQSFQDTIKFLKQHSNGQIVAYPLMLLPGTKLYRNKLKYELKEEPMGDYNLHYVTESYSFSKSEYLEMEFLANTLNPHSRLF
jgi:radical SAM superfamily enzyme YgiQ (UPF0313 family)